jgi:hypothetical protein
MMATGINSVNQKSGEFFFKLEPSESRLVVMLCTPGQLSTGRQVPITFTPALRAS